MHELERALRDEGLNVRTDPGWATRGGTWARGKPVGVMQHHTAKPVPYPINRLNGSGDGRIKCNIATQPNGEVWLVAARACNYSSGPGSGVVLADVINDRPAPTRNARARGLYDTIDGNRYFFNFENAHAGTGGTLPAIQEDAIVRATVVVNEVYGLSVNQTISHAEWTRRKIDPYWNGDPRCIEEIREMMEAYNMTFRDVPKGHTHEAAIKWLAETGITKGINPPKNDLFGPELAVTRAQMATFLKRYHDKFGK